VHHLQGKAERVKATDLLELLKEFHREKLALFRRHVAAARHVGNYDLNNTYQYIIAREDMHVAWVRSAVIDLGGTPDGVPEPEIQVDGRGDAAQAKVMAEDSRGAAEFVNKWRPRVERLTHARHKIMLEVILGETLEHKRFFDQALAGRSDLLGRRADGAGTVGVVLPTRWVG
jgi:hypothetical protein